MNSKTTADFPSTRYQGSKRKLMDWILNETRELKFNSVLDLFSGTSSISYAFKTESKEVTSNDKYKFNSVISKSIIENNDIILEDDHIKDIFKKKDNRNYDNFIERTFKDIFYLDEENKLLDIAIQNIESDLTGYHKDIAQMALFQACLAKRPYNLFHRANLYMRTADSERSFGNKTTWETSFDTLFKKSAKEINAAIFDNDKKHKSLNKDFLEVEGSFDLVYMDPPYMSSKGVTVNYLDFYHFLEGMTEYSSWPSKLTKKYKHIPYERESDNPWLDKGEVEKAFDNSLERYKDSIIVISYRSSGIPTIEQLIKMHERHGRKSPSCAKKDYKYVLSKSNSNKEVLIVSEP